LFELIIANENDIMYVMNEISIDTINVLKEYLVMTEVDSETLKIGYHEQLLYISFLKDFIHSFDSDDDKYSVFNITDSSVLFVFALLDSQPERTLKKLKEGLLFYNDGGMLETEKKTKFRNGLLVMINFLNFSVYLYNYVKAQEDPDKTSKLLELLTIFAISEYGSLYSSRSKNKYGYYFSQFIEAEDMNDPIRKFNTDEHRANYLNYTKRLKETIDSLPLTDHNDKSEELQFANIVITIGRMEDENLHKLGRRYYISVSKINKPHDTPLFITNFT